MKPSCTPRANPQEIPGWHSHKARDQRSLLVMAGAAGGGMDILDFNSQRGKEEPRREIRYSKRKKGKSGTSKNKKGNMVQQKKKKNWAFNAEANH